MIKVLLTGGTGFIGANLARLLLEKGRRVKVLVRRESDRGNLDGLDVETVVGDLRDFDSIMSAVRGCDEVYHVAAEYSFWSGHPESLYQSNVHGTFNIMEASLRAGVSKVVYTSTVGTIGLSQGGSASNESTPLSADHICNPYKRSKYEAEKVALSYLKRGLPLVIVNPSAPIGAWDRKPTPTGKIIVDFMQGKMPAYLETGLNLVHVQDVAAGHLLAAEKGRIGERYILGHQNLSLGEILRYLSDLTGRPYPKLRIPYGLAWTAGWVSTRLSDWVTHRPPAVPLEAVRMARRFMYFDGSKAVRELGLPQTSIVKALEDALAWFSDHGYFNKLRGEHKQWLYR